MTGTEYPNNLGLISNKTKKTIIMERYYTNLINVKVLKSLHL